MHQTKKGNQWHFGMKAHIGVDADTGIVHSMSATAANAHDVTQAYNLLHGGEAVVWGDAGYQGGHKREENLGLEVEWRVAMRPGWRRKLKPKPIPRWEVHFGEIDDDRKDSTAPHITFGPQLGGHR